MGLCLPPGTLKVQGSALNVSALLLVQTAACLYLLRIITPHPMLYSICHTAGFRSACAFSTGFSKTLVAVSLNLWGFPLPSVTVSVNLQLP